MNRGFVVLAQNNADTDYVLCAEVLAASIRRAMPEERVTLITDGDTRHPELFDQVIKLPHDHAAQDSWKLANDAQVYELSPYEYTIKLEADMFVPHDISWWFDILKHRDLVIATTIRDHANRVSTERFYRKFIDSASLPDTYNAVTYFRKSDLAARFYAAVQDVFLNWQEYQQALDLHKLEQATTDEVYAIAALIVGAEHVTMPTFTAMSMIHMKPQIVNSEVADWTNQFTYELTDFNFKIETIPQLYPVHYNIKSFAVSLAQDLDL